MFGWWLLLPLDGGGGSDNLILMVVLSQGAWKPKQLPNPSYFEEKDPFSKLDSIGAAGIKAFVMKRVHCTHVST